MLDRHQSSLSSAALARLPARLERNWALLFGALGGLAMLKIVMLAGLFTRTEPHPPLRFAPLFGASLALTTLAIFLILARSRWFILPTVLILLESLLSLGPQKLYPGDSDFFAQTPAVYPAIVAGSALIAIGAFAGRNLYRLLREEESS